MSRASAFRRAAPEARALLGALGRLGTFGMLALLWTGVMCTALARADAATLARIWNDLLWVWVTLSASAVVSSLLAYALLRRRTLRSRTASTLPPTAPS